MFLGQVQGARVSPIERSDDYALANDLPSFRAVWRFDGAIRDQDAIAIYQATSN